MRAGILRTCLVLLLLAFPLSVLSQTSPGYQNQEHVVNSGGSPAGGAALTSTNYRITLSSIGEGLTATGMSSSGYTMDGGFTSPYPPPGEVLDLRFANATTLGWDAEPSVGSYDVYRGMVAELHTGSYGTCLTQGLTVRQASDSEVPTAGQCFFYLVTAENRLTEEGTLGNDSSGTPRPNTSPCP